MTTVVITQPMYFPWIGLVSQLCSADIIIWLDDAQFTRDSFTHRVQLKSTGKQKWLTIPLKHSGSREKIANLQAAYENWLDHQIDDFAASARSGNSFQDALELLSSIKTTDSVCDLIIKSAELCFEGVCGEIRLDRTFRSSEMMITGKGWRRILDLVHAVGGTRYLTGHGAANYLDHAAFEAEGITVDYMGYEFLPWPQQHGDFSPYVTSLDLIANVPPENRTAHLSRKTVPWRDFLAARSIAVSD